MKTWEMLNHSERNALIAEKVLQLKVYDWKIQNPISSGKATLKYNGEEIPTASECVWTLSMGVPIPKYSSDIAAAWQVRDRIKEGLFSERHRFTSALQRVLSDRLMPEAENFIHPQEIILLATPEDICLAALVAKGLAEWKRGELVLLC